MATFTLKSRLFHWLALGILVSIVSQFRVKNKYNQIESLFYY